MTITVPELNPNVFSFDSLEGIIVVVALAFLVWCIARKFIKFVWWSIGLIFYETGFDVFTAARADDFTNLIYMFGVVYFL